MSEPSEEPAVCTAVPEPSSDAPLAVELDPTKLLADGQRLSALKNHGEAAEAFSKAVEALTAQYGELSVETVDPLIMYGKALLAVAISQSGVLGNTGGGSTPAAPGPVAPPSAPVAGPSQPSASTSTSAAAEDLSGPQFHFGAVIEDDSEDGDAAGEGEDGAPAEGDASTAAAVAPEDDLENAFGALEQARVILERVGTDESRTKLIGVHSLLGDVATENEDFDGAFKEYDAALKLQIALLPAHDRRIAETHMMIALALEFITDNKPDASATPSTSAAPAAPSTATTATTESGSAVVSEASRMPALEHVLAAKAVMNLRLEHLANDTTPEGLAETKDIKEVMVELDEKIEDLKLRPEMERQAAADKAAAEFALSGRSLLPSDTPVNNLNSLVKKKKTTASAPAMASNGSGDALKRKADEVEAPVASDSSSMKRQKTDENTPAAA